MKARRASGAFAVAAWATGALTGCTAAPPMEIAVGNCLNDGNAAAQVMPEVVDCARPHDNEAYLSIILEDGPFPGAEAITTTAIQECTAGFAEFAAIPYDQSVGLDFSWYYPSEETWAISDREILCLVHEVGADGRPLQSTGSLEGASR